MSVERDALAAHAAALWIGLMCGLQRDETLALTWRDINLAAGTLTVRGQYGKENRS